MAQKQIVIVLPLPPKELSPNGRPHHMAKARQTKRYREAAWATALEACGRRPVPRWETARATAVFYHRDRRRRDRDNLLASLKAAFDGIADAGVLADDSGLIHMPVILDIDRGNPRVEITIEPA